MSNFIEDVFNAYVREETAKVNERLNGTAAQQGGIYTPPRSSNAQANAASIQQTPNTILSNKNIKIAAVVGVVALVYFMAKK